MSRGRRKSSGNSNILGTQTRNKLREAAKKLEKNKIMSQEENKSSLSQVLSLIAPFDNKKITNVNFYLEEFDSFLDRADVKDDFRLQILKAKFTGAAREKLVLDDNLNSEKNYANFKTKILDIFSKKEIFTENQTKFNSIKQKPDQSVREFIEEFNILASKYFNITGYANEKGAKDFFELIKTNKFLEAINPLISLELRKTDIKEYSKLCEKALQLESAFKFTTSEQINNMTGKVENKDAVYENLLKQNEEQLAYIAKLSEQINELKLKKTNVDKKDKMEEKFCDICKTKKHDLQNCFYNGKNNNRKPNFRKQRNFDNFNAWNGINKPPAGFGYVTPNHQGYPPFMPNFECQTDNNYGNYDNFRGQHNYSDYGLRKQYVNSYRPDYYDYNDRSQDRGSRCREPSQQRSGNRDARTRGNRSQVENWDSQQDRFGKDGSRDSHNRGRARDNYRKKGTKFKDDE